MLDRRRAELDGRTGAAVDLLAAEVTRFEQLVTDLLELARADRPAERRPTDVVALTRSAAASRGLPVDVVQATGTATLLDVDPRRYEQLVVNLVDNAAKHGGGAVRIGLHVGPDGWCWRSTTRGPASPPTSAPSCSTASPGAVPRVPRWQRGHRARARHRRPARPGTPRQR